MFEYARADIEQSGVLRTRVRELVRALTLRWMFTRPRVLRAIGRLVWLYQASGLEFLVRWLKVTKLLPVRLQELGKLTPRVQRYFSDKLIPRLKPPRIRNTASAYSPAVCRI
jgi:glycolate oxidase iron-sulfur subunit